MFINFCEAIINTDHIISIDRHDVSSLNVIGDPYSITISFSDENGTLTFHTKEKTAYDLKWNRLVNILGVVDKTD